jgi:NAD(P)-dependent dehydrogenase (short-subunit alcohol dehydrogenase family)
MGRLDGKVAIVTAAGRGIGEAMVAVLAAEGASVVLADIDGALAEATADRIGAGVLPFACDVADPAQVQALVESTVATHGRLDAMLNNAGIEGNAPLIDLEPGVWSRTLAVNLDSVFYGIKYAAPAIIAAGGGAIVNTASVAGLRAVPNAAAYCASKAGVLALTRSAAIELRDRGVRVNAVVPGFVLTPSVEQAGRVFEENTGMKLDDLIVLKQLRWARAEEIARVALHLVSDEASFSSGVEYVVDNAMSVAI